MAQPIKPPLTQLPRRAPAHSHQEGRGLTSAVSRGSFIEQLRNYGVTHEAVLAVMAKVPRHEFLEPAFQTNAYRIDQALPIGHGQTISQALVVAAMTQALLQAKPKPMRVLEVGTGSGYQTAILAGLCDTVFTVERIRALSESARQKLAAMRFKNVHFGYADGSQGWAAFAPYDAILVTCAAEGCPTAMIKQLTEGGALVIPVGPSEKQKLMLYTRHGDGYTERHVADVAFVPLLGGRV